MRELIRHSAALIVIPALVCAGTSCLHAQSRAVRAGSVETESLLLRLCSATETGTAIEVSLDRLIALLDERGIDGSEMERLKDSMRCEHIVAMVAPVYDRFMADDELNSLVEFFECPAVRSRLRAFVDTCRWESILGNGIDRSMLLAPGGCDSIAGNVAVRLWFDIRAELQSAILPMYYKRVRELTWNVIAESYRGSVYPERKLLTAETIQAEVEDIHPSKYADIVRCLKGAGLRDITVICLVKSMSTGKDRFGNPIPAEAVERMERLTQLMVDRVNEDTLIAVLAPVYDRHFTGREMKALADFYRTRVSKTYVRIKLRQFREPERYSEIFLEEFDRMSRKEQDQLMAFRDTKAARKFIEENDGLSNEISERVSGYMKGVMDAAFVDLIEDADDTGAD